MALVLAIVTVVVAPVAYMAMFTGFRTYDDEGYFLLVVRDYVSGQPMLGPATPIYGPFFYETTGAVFKILGVTPGHDAGRYLTLAIWLLASLLAGWVAYRLTQSLVLAIAGELVAFQALIALTYEPTSPQALIALLVVSLVYVATLQGARPRLTAVLAGGVVAALLLIKINVGLFAGLAVALAYAAMLPNALRRWALPAMVVTVSLLPLALTAGLASQAWASEFAIEVALAAAALGATLLRARLRPVAPRDLLFFAAAAAGVAGLSLGIAIAGGTTLPNLWNGVVVVPLRFASIFSAPLEMNPALDVVAAASFAAAVFVALRAGAVSATVRAAIGLAMWIGVLLLPSSLYLFTLPLVWIAAVRPSGEAGDSPGGFARVLVPALAVVTVLQVYPVAGTQQSIAVLPQVFAGAICLADAIRLARPDVWARRFAVAAMAVSALTLSIHAVFTVPAYQQAVPLGLPGAKTMRLQSDEAAQVRAAVSALDQNCSAFITYPGLESFYLWTNQAPPTDLRSEVWMITYDQREQQSVVDQLGGQPRLCVLESRREIGFWARGRPIAQRPLVDFIDQEFTPAGTFGEYVLLVRRPV